MRLIDADALHNVLRKKSRWIVRNGDKHNEGYTYDQVHFAIDDMPTIEERKTGQWIWCGGSHKCSNCNEYTCFDKPVKYCPNCGAKMEVDKKASE